MILLRRRPPPTAVLGIVSVFLMLVPIRGEIAIPRGQASEWRYWDAAAAPDAGWNAPDFADKAWKSGKAPLGYGEDGLGAVLEFGRDEERKPLTAWFRKTFEIKSAAAFQSIALTFSCDDGAVVYLNGKELARANMPAGKITPTTEAAESLSDSDEGAWHKESVPAGKWLRDGANTIAVEVHQAYPASSDLFLDLELALFKAGEAPARNFLEEGAALVRRGSVSEGIDLLAQAPRNTPEFRRIMASVATQVSEMRDRSASGRAMDKLYGAAPDVMEVAYYWVRSHVERREGLSVKVSPRPLPKEPPEKFHFITDAPRWKDTSPPLPRQDILADLDYLEEMIANCYAYADRTGADWRGALDALRASVPGPLGRDTFLVRLRRFMTLFGDPHSSFHAQALSEPAGTVHAVFESEGDKVLALKGDRSDWLHPHCWHLSAIEGQPLERWLAEAANDVPQASPQHQRYLILQRLRKLPALAPALGVRLGETASLTLTDAEGKESAEVRVKISLSAPAPDWVRTKTERRDGVGILRLEQMDESPAFLAMINQAMHDFKSCRGIVIDVRGNGGGTQDALRTVLPYFMDPADPVKIVNVAAYRLPLPLPQPNPEGFLGLHGRGLHPLASSVWKPDEKAAIGKFLTTWKPAMPLPSGQFSDWHFMGIRASTNPAAFRSKQPVIVLMNEGCFSATDNFLGALKGHPGFTLLGTKSGGGSGRMARYQLPHAQFPLTLCQMASFHHSGFTYDGNGVPPDVVLPPAPSDFLATGGDTQLEAALKRLAK